MDRASNLLRGAAAIRAPQSELSDPQQTYPSTINLDSLIRPPELAKLEAIKIPCPYCRFRPASFDARLPESGRDRVGRYRSSQVRREQQQSSPFLLVKYQVSGISCQ